MSARRPPETNIEYEGDRGPDGKPHGKGTMHWPDKKRLYIGNFQDGFPEGHGLLSVQGGFMTGEFQRGRMVEGSSHKYGSGTVLQGKRDPVTGRVNDASAIVYHNNNCSVMPMVDGQRVAGPIASRSKHGAVLVGHYGEDKSITGMIYEPANGGKLSRVKYDGNNRRVFKQDTKLDPPMSHALHYDPKLWKEYGGVQASEDRSSVVATTKLDPPMSHALHYDSKLWKEYGGVQASEDRRGY